MYTQTQELYHHGIKGQKWGVRRFENEDGTLTKEGQIRYATYKKNKEIEEMNSELIKKYPKIMDDDVIKTDDHINYNKEYYQRIYSINNKYSDTIKLIKKGEQVYNNIPKETLNKFVDEYNEAKKGLKQASILTLIAPFFGLPVLEATIFEVKEKGGKL